MEPITIAISVLVMLILVDREWYGMPRLYSVSVAPVPFGIVIIVYSVRVEWFILVMDVCVLLVHFITVPIVPFLRNLIVPIFLTLNGIIQIVSVILDTHQSTDNAYVTDYR